MATLSDSLTPVPLLPPKYVSRPRLLADLDRAADLPLTLLCAGPGAGKTVLLTEWVQKCEAQVAWITPAAADAAPRRFWNLLESALSDFADTARGASDRAAQDTSLDPVDLLLSQASESAAPLAVIIDDAHLLTHPDILDGLDKLVRRWRPGLRLILAARSDPLLPLHRYRLAGQMAELRAADLAMTPNEIRQILHAHGVSLPDRDVDVLAARTEGWAAGVRLSAMRMEGTERPADFVSQLALDAGSIGEYLFNEVLQRLPGEQRRLLIEISFLDEVTGPLADAVTGMTGSDDILAALARDNSFVIPLDPLATRFRYHQLFGEILRYLLRRRGEQEVSRLKKRAAAWFEGNGDSGSALYWAVQADDGPTAGRLLAKGGLAHALVHRHDLSGLRLRDLVPAPDPESAESAVAAFAVEAALAAPKTAADELARLRAWRDKHALTDGNLLVTCDLAELLLGQKACDDRAVDAAAARLLSAAGTTSPVSPGLRAAVLLAQAAAHLWRGAHDDVSPLLEEAAAEARRDGSDGLELEALAMMACHDSLLLRANRADKAIQRAHAIRKSKGLGAQPAMELAAAVRALFSGDLSAQARAVHRIAVTSAVGADPALDAAAALVAAGGLLARDHRVEARIILREQADRVIPPALRAYRDVMLADYETLSGRPRAALALLDRGQAPDRGPGTDRSPGTEFAPVTAPAAARAHLALHDLRSARDCVRDVLASPSAQVSRYTLVDALLCDARIAEADGEEGQALEILVRAFDVARGEIALPFRCAQDRFAGLLSRHRDVASQWPAAPDDAAAPIAVPAQRLPRDLPEPLTPRELTILRLLATTMSTGEIAAELCLSVNTVKTHLASIYRKLPASRRREALLRARDLELI
jgi:LuxR family transcriptional regulator, maltose regulon positive regulatory protein